ncbi:MAG: prepilin-type N-terminal cleavage/methylation domain-containing protein [Candidatus Hydrogenedentes bacterium]|nr:prepilin-type N-terminal cleavage/methylation domain-containing protein [Candidatus Hydrogenedentota bacterium]
MGGNKGFTLIELMIVVALIAIIAAIAIPNLLRSRMSANEAGAAGAMRTLATAETQFQVAAFLDANGDGTGDYGTLANLANPDGAGASPGFIDSVLGTGSKSGYAYTVVTVAGGAAAAPAFTVQATPSAPGRSGYRRYFVDDTGVIRFTSDGTAATVASSPLN